MLSEFSESYLDSMLNVPPRQAATPEGRKVIAMCYRHIRAHCTRQEAMALRYEYRMSRAATFPNA